MRKLFCSIIISLVTGSSLQAQVNDSVISLPGIRVTASARVSREVAKAFKKTFPDAVYVRWFKFNKRYLTKFIKEDMGHQALFSKKGYLIYDISFGFESSLPEETRQLVRSSYSDYMVLRTANVKQGDRSVWIVNLKSLKRYVVLKVEEGEIEEIERFRRSDQ